MGTAVAITQPIYAYVRANGSFTQLTATTPRSGLSVAYLATSFSLSTPSTPNHSANAVQALRAVISLTCAIFRMPRFDGNAAAAHRTSEGGWSWLKAVGNQNKNGFAGWGMKSCPTSRTFALGFDDRL